MFKSGFATRLKPRETLIDLAPLVDVVFLLLIFFFVTSEILPLKSLPLKTPKISLQAPPIPSEIAVMMDHYGTIYVGSNKRVATLDSIQDLLKQHLPSLPNGHIPSIVLSVDEQIPYGMFLNLFSALYQTGYPIRLVFNS